ncbi:hypothetical protein DEM27_06100 [Metarhizobium album]|uniref:Uncharacterized protein n=1 Tax=Metarhizobium album TaxID=2182425 RepID=A0A2U2DV65_9HYPH|nr:hypothetical protein DEM27_06100 [Rhizobium album]
MRSGSAGQAPASDLSAMTMLNAARTGGADCRMVGAKCAGQIGRERGGTATGHDIFMIFMPVAKSGEIVSGALE